MEIKFDTEKHDKAIEIIANEISKLPANTPMDHGTFGATLNHTKREGEARSMARWFIENVDKIVIDFGKAITPGTEENAAAGIVNAEIERMSSAAIAKIGK